MHENNMVKEAEILKDRDSRGDITCSVERHAYVILAGNKIDDLTQALQNLKVNS